MFCIASSNAAAQVDELQLKPLNRASTNAAAQVDELQLKPLNRPPEYYTLLNKVAVGAIDKWKKIGLLLDIPIGQLNSVTTTDPILCYAEIFNLWQRNGSPPYTWATIIDALRSPIVGERQLAHELEEWVIHSTTI